ncbi:glutamate ligase domain-containing protein, partial [Rubrivirga sp.]|uniref:glutamate ligase domain-containing protein n=1 Tax=Rubrivirga sp. TaxID=1885344 RepID=UPI003C719F51
AWNAALAVRALEVALVDRIGLEDVRTGLAEVVERSGLRGRAEPWSRDSRVVLDVAHNPAGWAAALEAVDVPGGGRLWVVAGLMADKDVDGLAELFASRAHRVLAVGLEGDRSCPAKTIEAAFARHGLEVEVAASVELALRTFRREAAERDRVLVTGSHQTVAGALRMT